MNLMLAVRRWAQPVTLLLCCAFAPAPSPAAQVSRWDSPELQRVVLGAGGVMPAAKRGELKIDPGLGAELKGDVEIEAVVGTGGEIIHARVTASTDNSGSLGRIALKTAQQMRFAPAVEPYGGPKPSLVLLRLAFAPSNSPGPRVSARVSEVPLVPLPAGDDVAALEADDKKTPGLRPPAPVRVIQPRYTADTMRALVQGTVAMEVVILADGTVGAARVTRKLHPELDRQALIAARYWLFEPATLDGRPVATKAVIELAFTLR